MTHEKFEGERTLMRIHIGESDKWHGKPLHEAIVELLRKEHFPGATVLRCVGGFGSSSVYHTDKILRLSQDLPIVVEVVDSAERIEKTAHQRAVIREVIEHEHAARDRCGQRGETREMLRLAIDIEADDRLRPELLLLRNEERGLHLIVDGVAVGPERARRRKPLRGGHLFPQA